MPLDPDALPDHPHTWARTSLDTRLAWCRGFRHRLAASARDLCRLIEEEIGKPTFEGLTSDVAPLLDGLRWQEKHARKILRPRRVRRAGFLTPNMAHWVRREPLGRVAIIATWNYPVNLLGIQLAQALIAGNRVVVKPSEHAPRTQALLLDLATQGLPPGTLERTDPTREAGRTVLAENIGPLADDPVDHVVFTGSTAVGSAIAETLAPHLVPSTLELSGRDTAFVLSDADPRLAARSIWAALAINNGQTCMAPKRVLVHEGVYGAFLREIGFFAGGARTRPLISEEAARVCHEQAAAALARGARTVAGTELEPPRGRLFRPVVIADLAHGDPLLEGRNFGPVLAVTAYREFDEAMRIHRTCDQHLATSVFTSRPDSIRTDLARRLGVNTVTINDCLVPTAHPGTALAGVGASGWGTTQGRDGLLAMTRAVHVSVTPKHLRVPTDQPPAHRVEQAFKLIERLYGRRARGAKPPAGRPSPLAPRSSDNPQRTPEEDAAGIGTGTAAR